MKKMKLNEKLSRKQIRGLLIIAVLVLVIFLFFGGSSMTLEQANKLDLGYVTSNGQPVSMGISLGEFYQKCKTNNLDPKLGDDHITIKGAQGKMTFYFETLSDGKSFVASRVEFGGESRGAEDAGNLLYVVGSSFR